MSGKTKEVKTLIRQIEAAGGVVSKTTNGHWRVDNPQNGRWCQMAATPSDYRSLLNVRSRIKRIGLLLGTPRRARQAADPCR